MNTKTFIALIIASLALLTWAIWRRLRQGPGADSRIVAAELAASYGAAQQFLRQADLNGGGRW
jgi:hypothetical protein